MTNPLKSQCEIGTGQMIENQLRAPRPLPIGPRLAALAAASAVLAAASAVLGEGTPPFAATGTDGEHDPRGAGPRVVSLPLCVTPCSPFGASTRPTGRGNFGPATRGRGVRP